MSTRHHFRLSPCTTNQLSALLEEEVSGGHSPARASFIDSTDSLVSDKATGSNPAEPDCSAEVWTLSQSEGNSRGSSVKTGSGKDSGHSSTLESLGEKGNKPSGKEIQ